MLIETSKKQNILNFNKLSPLCDKDKISNFSQLNNNNNINNDLIEINQSIISNNLDKLISLLKSGKNPNISNNLGETPLFTSIELDNINSMNILLEYGANCNIQKKDGNSPLHMAINEKKERIINLLLDKKASPNLINKINFQTPFHLAIINKLNKKILEKFKENNVDWNIKDKYNKTAFDYALELKDNNYLLLLDNIFGSIKNDNNLNLNQNNANNFKALPKKIADSYNNKLINRYDENKENSNYYNIIGETNAYTMSEPYSSRDNNTINSKNKFIYKSKEKIIKIKNCNDNFNNINNINNFTLAKQKHYNTKSESSFNNEKDNIDSESKAQFCKYNENKGLMKEILMDTIKKVNKYNTFSKNNTNKKNIDDETSNYSKAYNISQKLNFSVKKLNPSETNNLVCGISTTIFDETEMNSNIFISSNENKKTEQLSLKDLIENTSQNETLNYTTKENNDLNKQNNINKISMNSLNNNKGKKINELKNNEKKNSNIKYMILQQIKEKNKKIEIGSPLNIPNETLSKLRFWLISCDLLNYYNLLIEKNLYDIDKIISQIKNKKIEINYKYIEEIGIKKPGHIFRFILKLQIDAEIMDKKLCDSILEKFSNNNSSSAFLNSSSNNIRCCGISCFSHSASPSEVSETANNLNNNDIFSFLKSKDLLEFKDNFIHNGFDQVDYIILQLFSKFQFDKNMMCDYFHIYLESAQRKVIKKLYDEKEKIAKELNIQYNKMEIKEILASFNDIYLLEKQKDIECFIF